MTFQDYYIFNPESNGISFHLSQHFETLQNKQLVDDKSEHHPQVDSFPHQAFYIMQTTLCQM